MKTFRTWHLLLLLGVTMDFVNPELPGVFSSLHEGFFVYGLTRSHAGGGDGNAVGDWGRTTPAVFADGETTEPRGSTAGRAIARQRRVHQSRDVAEVRRPAHVSAASSLDAEDH